MRAVPTQTQQQSPATSSPSPPHTVSPALHTWHVFSYHATKLWQRLLILLLGFEAVRGLYEATTFLLQDYRVLENHFQRHTADSAQVTAILTEAISIMLATIISIAFAIRLTRSHERTSHLFELLMGTAVVIWYKQILAFLLTLDYSFLTQLLSG